MNAGQKGNVDRMTGWTGWGDEYEEDASSPVMARRALAGVVLGASI